MNTEVTSNFAVKPLVAAVALAVSAVNVYAAPTPNQMPGAGTVTAVSVGATAACTVGCAGGGGVGTVFTSVPTPSTITLAGGTAKAVIQWGGSGAPVDPLNPAGFNIGSNGKLTFASAVAGAAVLNIDASGNPSQIYGQMDAAGAAPPAIFVSNANGIIVSSGGRIAAPNGVGLIGANLNNAAAINDFTENNVAAATGCTNSGCVAGSFLDVTNGQSTVTIAGNVNGSLTVNAPASYILLVGGDVTNTGNLYANQVDVSAGMRAIVSEAGINDTVVGGPVPVVAPFTRSVHRLWNVNSGSSVVNGDLGVLPGNVEVAAAGNSFVNTGSVSSNGGWIGIEASGSIRSGTSGSADLLVGLFADAGVVTSTFSDASKTELYNVVTGYTTGVTMPFLYINQQTGAQGDVTINALTRASQPSSIYTTGDVRIKGGNVNINSTINHEVAPAGTYGGNDLIIEGTKSVSITADVGAAHDVRITEDSTLVISGNVNSNTDRYYGGGIYIYNTGSGGTTTISGNLTARAGNSWWTSSYIYGSPVVIGVKGPLTISGAVTAETNSVSITNTLAHAPTAISGPVWGGEGNVTINVNGPLNISGNVTASQTNWFGYCCSGGNVYITNNASFGNFKGDSTVITGDVWGDQDAIIHVSGALTINGDVTAYYGHAGIYNHGLASGNTTTITGDVFGGGYSSVDIWNYGQVNSKLVVSGNVSSNGGVHVVSYGDLDLSRVDGRWIDVGAYGLHAVFRGPLTAMTDFYYTGPTAQTNVLPDAVITGDTVTLEVRNFQGVGANELPYTSAAQKPLAQIIADYLYITAYGTVNAPIVGNTNWLMNSMDVAPRFAPDWGVNATISAEGASFQAINLKFMGDFTNVNSGDTMTPFEGVGLTTGTGAAGALQGNVGSQMIIQAEKNLYVSGGSNPGGTPGSFFQFPGGVVLKAGDSITVWDPLYNAWTTIAQAFQGVFLEAPVINTFSYFATNGNSWVNWSTLPTGQPPNTVINSVYQITMPTVSTFNFEINQMAPHINSYEAEILGGPVNSCPIGFSC